MKRLTLLLLTVLFSTITTFSQVTMYHQDFDNVDSQYYTETDCINTQGMADDYFATWKSMSTYSKYFVNEESEMMHLYGSDTQEWKGKINFNFTQFGCFADSIIRMRIKFRMYGDSVISQLEFNYAGLPCPHRWQDTFTCTTGTSGYLYFDRSDIVPSGYECAEDFVATLSFEIPDTAEVYVEYIKAYAYNKVVVPDPHARYSYDPNCLYLHFDKEMRDQTLYIYSFDGRLVYTEQDVDITKGRNMFDVSLGVGAYIVRVGDVSKKIFIQ